MNLFPYILGPVWVLDVTLTSDGHTIAAWRCKMGGEPQQTVYDAAAVAKGVAVVTVSGHGTIVKPADSQLAARVRDDRATFLWSEHDGRIAFVRRERLQGMLTELSEAGIHPQQIEPEMEGTHTGDYIVLKGSPAVNMAINPEVDGGIGTIAMIVNMIPHVINARPGLRTMLDLPVPRAIMGDFRDYIEK